MKCKVKSHRSQNLGFYLFFTEFLYFVYFFYFIHHLLRSLRTVAPPRRPKPVSCSFQLNQPPVLTLACHPPLVRRVSHTSLPYQSWGVGTPCYWMVPAAASRSWYTRTRTPGNMSFGPFVPFKLKRTVHYTSRRFVSRDRESTQHPEYFGLHPAQLVAAPSETLHIPKKKVRRWKERAETIKTPISNAGNDRWGGRGRKRERERGVRDSRD